MNAKLALKINKTSSKCTFSCTAHAKMALPSASACKCKDQPKLPSCCPSYSTVTCRKVASPLYVAFYFDLQPLDAFTLTRAYAELRMQDCVNTHSSARTKFEKTLPYIQPRMNSQKHLAQPHVRAPVRRQEIRRHRLLYLSRFFACATVLLDAGGKVERIVWMYIHSGYGFG